MSRRLLAAVSSHGYGHAMQTCLVLNALHTQRPDIQIVLRTDVSPAFLRSRLSCEFTLLPGVPGDFGMPMRSALEVDCAAADEAYRAFHQDWERHLAAECRLLQDLHPDVILSNIPYLTLSAAQRLGIPNIALCCLHWGDIYAHYCAGRPESAEIHQRIFEAYQNAARFIRPVPHMPMPGLQNTHEIAPLAEQGMEQRAALCVKLDISPKRCLVLCGLGGIDTPLSLENWPAGGEFFYLTPPAWDTQGRPDAADFSALEMSFADILRSCDILLTKPGYGSYTEAACNAAAVLYLSRPDWPESVYLNQWLKENAACREIKRTQIEGGEFKEILRELRTKQAPSPSRPGGAAQAAEVLEAFFCL